MSIIQAYIQNWEWSKNVINKVANICQHLDKNYVLQQYMKIEEDENDDD